MSEFPPVITLQDYATLNAAEVAQGYVDGIHGIDEAHDTATRSYQHGWKNGAFDGGFRDADPEQVLFREIVISQGNA